MGMGRPSEYSEEVASAILAEIATTRCGLAAICDSNPDFPEPRTVYRWMLAHDDFCQRYARAKADQTQVLEDEILEIADNTQLGVIETVKDNGNVERKTADMLEHRRLRIESRKWLLGKLKPKKYGDRTILTGDSDADPIKVEVEDVRGKLRHRLSKPAARPAGS